MLMVRLLVNFVDIFFTAKICRDLSAAKMRPLAMMEQRLMLDRTTLLHPLHNYMYSLNKLALAHSAILTPKVPCVFWSFKTQNCQKLPLY